ncbi:hypothetical protein CRE_10402 [Caenorhabditis remanei]|uniref:Transposase Tc5 C-terminal domain-containing protein n=1 Tax=Caenorhabditis remanei TaxID=31234 RepID=E3MQL0_CAERE|nr:hypothetical protein CRE_10402 [Caenorhabditis remanei]
MSMNVAHILYILSQTFPLPVPNNPDISRQERNLANHIINIIKEAETGEIEIEETEELVDEDYDGDYETPSEYCFGPEVSNENCYINGCSEMSFILCSRCKLYICFDHFCISLNHFCPVA